MRLRSERAIEHVFRMKEETWQEAFQVGCVGSNVLQDMHHQDEGSNGVMLQQELDGRH
jgi:hypothetical protein